ncbi:GNAT family N-acetyltransferase [Kribbella kalugense]|uniref:Acetyltransferase (GNAT) family protein n=1 Tax=Kribbella kalugense TaxID=2512221 RepID=A0A4R7ZCG6_9ACTN|nr:GNAT family N-acetyltransferase [Kribbella kalugense]TDW15253.1 acetyltransferase (GNAT) family protein [Kribbella kalugense]
MTTVRAVVDGDIEACLEIVRALPEYFTADVPEKVRGDLGCLLGWVAVRDGQVVGFVVVERRGTRAAEILWAAVDPSARRQGIGSQLAHEVMGELRATGVKVVELKTLDAAVDYKPYEATRAFWERMGFVQIDTIDPLPGWNPGNPAAIYVAGLAPTASQ